MATLARTQYLGDPSEVDFRLLTTDGLNRAQAYIEKLKKKMTQMNPDDPNCDITGAILEFPVADGSAVYIVTKQKPLTLSHIPYCDGYEAAGVTIRGVNRSYVLQVIRSEKIVNGIRGTRQWGWAPQG